jgi:hypothetical protein
MISPLLNIRQVRLPCCDDRKVTVDKKGLGDMVGLCITDSLELCHNGGEKR